MATGDVKAKVSTYSVHIDVDETNPEQPSIRIFTAMPDATNEMTTTDPVHLGMIVMHFVVR
jgi:hypothetical protein